MHKELSINWGNQMQQSSQTFLGRRENQNSRHTETATSLHLMAFQYELGGHSMSSYLHLN